MSTMHIADAVNVELDFPKNFHTEVHVEWKFLEAQQDFSFKK
jgi:hypothetical protein